MGVTFPFHPSKVDFKGSVVPTFAKHLDHQALGFWFWVKRLDRCPNTVARGLQYTYYRMRERPTNWRELD